MPEYVKNKGYVKKGTALFNVPDSLMSINIAPLTPIPIFQSELFNDSDSILKVSTTQIRLSAGRKYKLSGSLCVIMTSLSALVAQFYNVTSASYVGDMLRLTPSTDTSNACVTGSAELFIIPNIDTIVEFRCTVGTIASMYSGSKVIIEEVEAYLSVSAGELPYASDPEDIKIDGIQSVGILDKVPRADHVHPTTGDGIIESGSNSNGRYIKFRDGTMICWGIFNITYSLTTLYVANYYYSNITWSLPASFVNLTYSAHATFRISGQIIISAGLQDTKSVSTVGFFCTCPYSLSNSGMYCDYYAIGRWKE